MKQRRPRLRELTNPESSHVRAYPEKDPNGALAVFEKGHKVAKFKRIQEPLRHRLMWIWAVRNGCSRRLRRDYDEIQDARETA